MMTVDPPEPVALEYAVSSLRAAYWRYQQQIASLGYSTDDNVERRRLQFEQRALADVATWLEAQAARMQVP